MVQHQLRVLRTPIPTAESCRIILKFSLCAVADDVLVMPCSSIMWKIHDDLLCAERFEEKQLEVKEEKKKYGRRGSQACGCVKSRRKNMIPTKAKSIESLN